MDAENYRAKREQSLEALAAKVAAKVIKYKRKPSYSVSFLHRIFLLSCPHTIILDISD